MADSGVKLAYSAQLFRIRAEFLGSACGVSEQPPSDVAARAIAKMEAVKTAGQIAYFRSYAERFNTVWQKIRELGDKAHGDPTMISISLAAGAPELPGFIVEKPTAEKTLANISIAANPDVVKGWRWEWMKLILYRELEKLGIKGYADPAQLIGMYLRASAGEQVKNQPIMLSNVTRAQQDASKPYMLVANKSRREISVVVYDVMALALPEAKESFFASVVSGAQKLQAATGGKYRVLKQDVLAALTMAERGAERFNLDLPFVHLVATAAGSVAAATAQPAAKGSAVPASYPGMGALKFDISNDGMEATVGEWPVENYQTANYPMTKEWLTYEARRAGITHGFSDELTKAIMDRISVKDPMSGLPIARGDAGAAPKGAKLVAVYQDGGKRDASSKIDLREMQKKSVVAVGELIAEVNYDSPARKGMDVRGTVMPAPAPEPFDVKVGEGVECREGKYYATMDGMPAVDPAGAISINKVLVHKGDVNLSSGNVHFNGAVEITGAIDSGAYVSTGGDLIVHGGIRGGRVKCGGSVSVKDGINTGEKGRIYAKGDVRSDFIQNSHIICGGKIIAEKNILTSQLVAGDAVWVLSQEGAILGGTVSARNEVKVFNLGQPNGAPTEVRVGVDWQAETRVRIRERRLASFEAKVQEFRNSLRDLVRKSAAQMTARHEQMKKDLSEKVSRARGIQEKLKKSLEDAQQKLSYNSDSRVIVPGRASVNIRVNAGGNPVVLENEVAGVALLAKKFSGSHMVSVEDYEAREKIAADEKAKQDKISGIVNGPTHGTKKKAS